jgi:hypothetical protein
VSFDRDGGDFIVPVLMADLLLPQWRGDWSRAGSDRPGCGWFGSSNRMAIFPSERLPLIQSAGLARVQPIDRNRRVSK